MDTEHQTWQVMSADQVYETDLETLKQWISEGAVLPTDRVRRGRLRWIEAARAPALHAVFRGETVAASVSQPSVEARPASQTSEPVVSATENSRRDFSSRVTEETRPANVSATTDECRNHPGTAPEYVCRVCNAQLCGECPRFVSKVAVCPFCGDLCKPFEALKQQAQRVDFQTSGFGIADFAQALCFPFRHLVALFCGAAVYGFLLLGGWRGRVIACAILFGCISHVINLVVAGKRDRSFMPDFGSFTWWDDIIQPFFLSLGVIIVTWGPVVVLVAALLFGFARSGPATDAQAAQTARIEAAKARFKSDIEAAANPDQTDPRKRDEAIRRLDSGNVGQYTDAASSSPAGALTDQSGDTSSFTGLARPLIASHGLVLILLLGAVAWGVFYYPMALAVAGYTESFGAVVNPLIGLDTIRRMGAVYAKAFGMYVILAVAQFALSSISGRLLSPFDLPFVGNLPARVLDGAVTFYMSMALAFVLGLALYKCADRIGIESD